MTGNKDKLKTRDVEEALLSGSKTYRRRAIVRRRIMEKNRRMTDEEIEDLVSQNAVVKDEFRCYMLEEIKRVSMLVQEIEAEPGWWKKRKLTRWLLDDLKPLLPDLIELLE